LAFWFVSFSTFLNASHHHPVQWKDCGESNKPCQIEHTRHNTSDDATGLASHSVPGEPASAFSSICFVCLLLAANNAELPSPPPRPILSDIKTVSDVCKTVSFRSTPDQSPDSTRAPPC